jgi:hypothetical protein
MQIGFFCVSASRPFTTLLQLSMSHNPLRMLGDSAELDYAAFVFDQSVHGRIWLLRANNVFQSNDTLLLPCWTRCVIVCI